MLLATVIVTAGCRRGGSNLGSAEARHKAAVHQKDRLRRDGIAASVTTRGESDEIVVLRNLVAHETDLCSVSGARAPFLA